MYVCTIRMPGEPDADHITGLLDHLADANATWYLAQWAQGKDPPCCSRCAGIRHVPDPRGGTRLFRGAPELIRNKRASCHEIAAMEVGIRRAKALSRGADPPSVAAAIQVVLIPVEHRYWHAVAQYPDGEWDPAVENKE